jgi:hypothetical protein
MNSDVLKSLGYLKKSLKMSHKAISNAVSKDAQALVEFNVIATGVHNLINEIEKVEVSSNSSNSSIPAPTVSNISPIIQMVAQNAALDDSQNGINFLDP